MLKHLPQLQGKSSQAALKEFELFIHQPTPREIPETLATSCIPTILPIGKIIAVTGLILTIVSFAIFLLVFPPIMLLTLLVLPLLMLSGLEMMLIGYILKNRKLKILQLGELYEGKIIKMSPSGLKNNGRGFYKTVIEFQDAQNNLTTCTELIRSDIADQFFTIKDSETDDMIDLLYTPTVPRLAILPLKIISMSKYEQSESYR